MANFSLKSKEICSTEIWLKCDNFHRTEALQQKAFILCNQSSRKQETTICTIETVIFPFALWAPSALSHFLCCIKRAWVRNCLNYYIAHPQKGARKLQRPTRSADRGTRAICCILKLLSRCAPLASDSPPLCVHGEIINARTSGFIYILWRQPLTFESPTNRLSHAGALFTCINKAGAAENRWRGRARFRNFVLEANWSGEQTQRRHRACINERRRAWILNGPRAKNVSGPGRAPDWAWTLMKDWVARCGVLYSVYCFIRIVISR